MKRQRSAIGTTVIAMSVIAVILAGIVGLFLVAPQYVMHPTTATTTEIITQTVTSTEKTTTRTVVGAENQCGFVSTCNVFNSAGLELSLSVNSTTLRPNGTIALNVTDTNTLPITNNFPSSAQWLVGGVTWPCWQYWYPDGILVFRGYYALDNLTGAKSLDFWYPIACPVEVVGNGTRPGIFGVLSNVTGYSFLPGSDEASYSAYFYPVDSVGQRTGPLTMGKFLPVSTLFETSLTAASSYGVHYQNLLGSTAPAVYTLVAEDEWGDLVLLHFSVA